MNRIFTKDAIIDIGFYGGLAIKAINAVMEVLGGVMLMLITPDGLSQIIRQIALPELREDPTDPVMNYLLGLCQNFSSSTQASIAVYMLLHGATKLAIIWFLWKKILWTYPLAMGIFAVFIGYEIYGYMHSQSLLVLLIITLDAAILTLIILEYIRLKKIR